MKTKSMLKFLPGDEELDERCLSCWKAWSALVTNVDVTIVLNVSYRMALQVNGDTRTVSKDPMAYFKWRNSLNL